VCQPLSQQAEPPSLSLQWNSTCTRMGIKHMLTTAYHPRINKVAEHVHMQKKDDLRARGAGPAWHCWGYVRRLRRIQLRQQQSWLWYHPSSSLALVASYGTARARSSTCQRASTAHTAGILCSSQLTWPEQSL
jgi:hypothetical protein